MTKISFSEATLRSHATPSSFERGEDYYQGGAVIEVIKRDHLIQARVEGNELEPYTVTLECDRGGIRQAYCSCPYGFEGWCKHIVATGLVCLRRPQQVEERPPLAELLSDLNLHQARQLIEQLVQRHPELHHEVDRLILKLNAVQPSPPSKPQRQTSVNPAPFCMQTRQLLRETREHWEWGGEDNPLRDQLPDLVAEAEAFSRAGDGANAIVILAAITETCATEWDELADLGGNGEDVVSLLDPAWAAAILNTELSSQETIDTQVQLEEWGAVFSQDFAISTEALRQGWDDPALEALLQGREADLWPDGRPDCADDLTLIRLNILERQERLDEYLNLAHAEGLWQAYLTLLIRLNRIAEALTYSDRLTYLEDAFAVAKALRERGEEQAALELAVQGLSLAKRPIKGLTWYELNHIDRGQNYYKYDLATWTSELAEGLGDRDTALATQITAFQARPSQADYARTHSLAEGQWPTVRSQLLDYLRQLDTWTSLEAKVNIFLEEGLIADAIATIDQRFGYDPLLLRVMQAAISVNPQWVIDRARQRAEDIIDRGKAEAYDTAVQWLEQVKAAYTQLEELSEWQTYRDQLKTKHGRKYKLMNLMKTANLL
uniref:Zinc finger SWIM domain protein n=1 Tax=Cyanothece sp. (strain PCC 7425 / ATCC 29141) TaxID=395961 RepID=B8HQN2_CYAP4